MKFLSIQLKNYIGIYNGLGLNEIYIDFRLCRHKTVIIKGANGSGKSTLMKALSLFPDGAECFIPGLPAMKELYLQDGNIVYIATFTNGIKSNGEREVTKAYLRKVFPDGTVVTLNENGNVTAYKDVLFQELRLDANFIALSQLSMDDRGLAMKKPAERKRFVNNIVTSVEVYNGIYKTLNKRSSTYKAMINSIVGKINQLGDKIVLTRNLKNIESRLVKIEEMRSEHQQQLGVYKSQIVNIDPTGELQERLAIEKEKVKVLSLQVKSLETKFKKYTNKDFDEFPDIRSELITINSHITTCNTGINFIKETVTSLMRDKEVLNKDFLMKNQKLISLSNTTNILQLEKDIEKVTADMKEIEERFSVIGISDIINITKDEYILALETIKNIKDNINTLKSSADMNTLSNAVAICLGEKEPINLPALKEECLDIQNTLEDSSTELIRLEERLVILGSLDKRPNNCKIDSCPFIVDALQIDKKDLLINLDIKRKEVEVLNKKLSTQKNMILYGESILGILNNINNIIRDIRMHSSILRKLPNGVIYSDPKELFRRFIEENSDFKEMEQIYSYLDYANNFELYKNLHYIKIKMESDLQSQQGKVELVNSIRQDLEYIKEKQAKIDADIDSNNNTISNESIRLVELKKNFELLSNINSVIDEAASLNKELDISNDIITRINDQLDVIAISIVEVEQIEKILVDLDKEQANLIKDRDRHCYAIEVIDNYKREYEQLSREYDVIETIKYYSSPTTGIQLVFMELYMGKIISLANDLLGLLFGGRFSIQQFIINENEFRIPCIGDGYMNDDISSMSSSQLCMISMIISFALLYHSSTKFNIIKLDEIDSPLDESNRYMFIEVLNKIIEIMNTEQCILISHNTELSLDTSDVIVLKDNGMDYSRGNVIWKY